MSMPSSSTAPTSRGSPKSAASPETMDELKGFQRKEIRTHVNAIVEFLDSGPVLFPNAIILALSPEVEFKNARGSRPEGMTDVADTGTLTIPIRPEGQRAAWIVDGQQRSLALARAKNNRIPVPVIGFVSPDLETQREQFILVNKAKPLPTRLINELLPEVSALLPRDLAARKLPSELCNLLNRDPRSPFHRLIRRASDAGDEAGVVTDTALIEAIKQNLKPPLGALSQYRRGSSGEGMRCRRHVSHARPVLVGGAGRFSRGLGQAADREPPHALGRHPRHGCAHGPDHAAGRARPRHRKLRSATRSRGSRRIAAGPMGHGKGLAGAGTRSRSRASTSPGSVTT